MAAYARQAEMATALTTHADAVMRAGFVAADVGEVQVLGQQESVAPLRGLPDRIVICSSDALVWHRINVMSDRRQHGC